MQQVSLAVTPRGVGKGAARAARRAEQIPAVVYGHGLVPQAVQVGARDFGRATAAGHSNAVFLLKFPGDGGVRYTTMIKDVQKDPLTDAVLHVDFNHVSLAEQVRMAVPVVVAGEDDIIKRGLVVQHFAREVEVECLPADVPDRLVVDVAALRVGDHISVGGLAIPAAVRLLTPVDEVVVAVLAPKGEEAPAEAEAPTSSEPELVRKEKEAKEQA